MQTNDFRNDTNSGYLVEPGAELLLEFDSDSMKVKGKIVGMEPPDYLIVRINHSPDNQRALTKGEALLANYKTKNLIFGFQSNIINMIYEPESLLFINYPATIENFNIRTQERAVCFMPVKLEVENHFIEGAIIDITMEGCCCTVQGETILNERPFEELSLHIIDSDGAQAFSLTGIIKSMRENSGDYYFGINFKEHDRTTQALLKKYVPSLTLCEQKNECRL